MICVGGVKRNFNLDDALGFFKELVDPNFCEFYWGY